MSNPSKVKVTLTAGNPVGVQQFDQIVAQIDGHVIFNPTALAEGATVEIEETYDSADSILWSSLGIKGQTQALAPIVGRIDALRFTASGLTNGEIYISLGWQEG